MIYDYNKEKHKKGFHKKIIAGIIAAIVGFALIAAVGIYLEVLQLDEIGGFSGIFLTNLVTRVIIGAVAFVCIFAFVALTNMFVKRNMDSYLKQVPAAPFRIPNYTFAFVFAFLGALAASNVLSQNVLMYLNSTPFNSVDPIFGQDVGYYLFQRPFQITLFDFLSGLWFMIMLYTLGYYAIHFLNYYRNFSINYLKDRKIITHNIINISLFFLIKAISFKYTRENILYSRTGNVNGAGYTDIHVWLPFYNIAPFLIGVVVIAAIYFVLKGKLRAAVIAVAVYPAAWVLVGIASAAVQGLVVSPNEFLMEKPYLKYDMEKTREAYSLDRVVQADFDIKQDLNADTLRSNIDIINNIRVVDYQATLRSSNQLQSIRTFFRFHEGDIINYTINGKETAVMIAAREISKDRLTESTYVNTRFKFTHGYGLVMNPINTYTAEGQTDFIIRDIPPQSVDPALKVTQPRVYYGELTNDYVFVGARELKEIDGDNDEFRYDGKGGIRLGFFNRLLMAVRHSDFNMLISGYVAPDTRILINRNVHARAQKPVPFLRIDNDPYLLLTAEGRLIWVLDGYTVTNYYPYSQTTENYNYIRNSVKVVVDAYDGTTNYYLVDRSDPIAVTYDKIYPGLFTKTDLPEDVKRHMRYPERLFDIQTEMMKRYHFDPNADEGNIEAFYNNEDVWDIAKYQSGQTKNEKKEIDPYYNMIRLPGDLNKGSELILMRPFTPTNKDNMVSWMAVRNAFDDYGKLVLFTFPKTKTVFGPNQVETQINQHPDISKDITLWGQGSSRVFKGNLLVIPIGDSLLYVEPIYIEASNEASIPQVRGIITGYQVDNNLRITYGLTLQEALNKMFTGANLGVSGQPGQSQAPAVPGAPGAPGGQAVPGAPGAPGGAGGIQNLPEEVRNLINRAVTTYEEAKRSSQNGDWENFGKRMKELDGIMEELNRRK